MIYQIAPISQRGTQGAPQKTFGLIQARRIQANVRARGISATLPNDGPFRNSLISAVSRAG